MTQSIMNKIKLAFIAASFALAAHAQNGINTPYSRYGFGIQSERAMGFNKGMGGVAQGFRNGQEVNIANPASYSAVDSLTALFDMGISLQNSNHKMGGLQQNIRNSCILYSIIIVVFGIKYEYFSAVFFHILFFVKSSIYSR